MRTLPAILGLAVVGAALSPTGAHAAPILAGLSAGVAGNLATDIYKEIDRQSLGRFLDAWRGIEDRDTVAVELRLCQLRALQEITRLYAAAIGREDDRADDRLRAAFEKRLRAFLKTEFSEAQKLTFADRDGDELRQRVTADLPQLLARGIESGATREGGPARVLVEAAVLEELAIACGNNGRDLPASFKAAFRGLDGAVSWYQLFIRDAASKLANADSDLAAMWAAEQTAIIRAYVSAIDQAVSANTLTLSAINQDLAAGLKRLEQIAEDVSELRNAAGPGKSILQGRLPDPPADFIGRSEQKRLLLDDLRSGRSGLISAVRGMGGVGKTSLAAVVGGELIADYPDGQIWIDLKGSRPTAISTETALGRLIHAVDLVATLPDSLEERRTLLAALLRGRRCLLVLDDARDAAHVAALMPPSPSAALITSRRTFQLPGLQGVSLPVLPLDDAVAFMNEVAGASGRVLAADRAETIAERCGCLPLALRSAGAFLAENPDWSAEAYLARLSAERMRLNALRPDDQELDVRAVLGFSFDQLSQEGPELAERWVMLSVIPGHFDSEAAAAVWACDAAEAKESLSALLRRAMLEFDGAIERYRFHDLMRDLAEDLMSGSGRDA